MGKVAESPEERSLANGLSPEASRMRSASPPHCVTRMVDVLDKLIDVGIPG
jgi:hypothetical protein